MVVLFSGSACGPRAMDCRPKLLIAVSVAENGVLSRVREAQHVVLKMW